MAFTFNVWKLTIIIDLFDLDLSDKSIGFSIYIRWE